MKRTRSRGAELRGGSLVEVLADHALPRRAFIHALYTRARPLPPKIAVFLEHLAERVKEAGLAGA